MFECMFILDCKAIKRVLVLTTQSETGSAAINQAFI